MSMNSELKARLARLGPVRDADPPPSFSGEPVALVLRREGPLDKPVSVIKRLHEAAVKGLTRADVKEKIAFQGMDSMPSASPEAFDAELTAEAPMWERVVRDSGARIE